MTFERPGLTAFVPKGDDKRATARALVDLATANGMDTSLIQSANDGFYITDELADVLYDESTEDESTDSDEAPAETDPKKKRK
jgi:hypothetical protein